MPSSHLILCHPLLLLPPIPPSIRVFSNESTLLPVLWPMRWPKYWSFSFSIIPSKEHPGLISLEWTVWISLQSKGLSRVFSNTTVQKHKLTKIKHKEQILKVAREKQQITQKGIPMRITADLSTESEVAQSCPTLCNPIDCSPPGSSVHGISQARILKWVAISFSGGSSQPRDRSCISCIGRWILYCWATREAISMI